MASSASPPAAKAQFLAFVPEASDVAVLGEFALDKGWETSCVHTGDIRQATLHLKKHASPELLLVDVPSVEEAPALLDALAEVCDPTTKVIVTGLINQYSFYCWLTDIGIFNYMLRPLTLEALDAVYQKSLAPPASAQKSEKPPAKIIAVMGTRGGVGATSVAINLAGIIAEQTRQQVALVDLDAQEGSVALALDMEPSRGFREVLEQPDRIDSLFIDRVMQKIGKYLSVLTAEESIGESLNVTDQASDPLLTELRGKYDYIVLDVPRHFNSFSKQCLKYADHTILVTELSLLSLRDTIRMQDAMRDGWKTKAPLIVANRIGLSAKQELPVLDFEKGASCSLTARISFLPDLFMSISNEIPAVKHKKNEAMKPLYELASLIVPQMKKPDGVKAKSSFTLFKKKGS